MAATRTGPPETAILEQGLHTFARLVDLTIEPYRAEERGLPAPHDPRADLLFRLTDQDGTASRPVLAEAKRLVSPAMVRDRLQPRIELIRRLNGDASVLVISPWLSPRTRNLLDELGYGYLDLTGNISFRLDRPIVRLRLDGARTDPGPRPANAPRQLGGAKAGRLVRALVDVAPPYTLTQLSAATELSLPYVSRLLDAFREEGLVTDRGRKADLQVDWPSLLRARAEAFPLIRKAHVPEYVAPQGIEPVLEKLRARRRTLGPLAVTGPVAAAAVAPITIGGQLLLYCQDSPSTGSGGASEPGLVRQLGLLPTRRSGDVLLLPAPDSVVFTNARLVDGLPHVALSQLVLDSLSGPGRMPAEGEAVLHWMLENRATWRLPRLLDWKPLQLLS